MSNKNPVINNHFIPCYWTAYWNSEYLIAKRKNEETKYPRKVHVSYFNLKAGKILNAKTEKIFIDKYRGLAPLETENDFEKIKENYIYDNDEHFINQHYSLVVDFENHFTEYENLSKPALLRTIKSKSIKDIKDKTHLAQFFILQSIRNPSFLDERLSFIEKKGKNKLDLLLDIKSCFADIKKIENLIIPLVYSKWTLYSVKKGILPISDKPILDYNNHIFIPLAPDILIEVELNIKTEEIASYKYKIPTLKYLKFKNRTIKNMRNGIVGHTDLLKKWEKRIK